MEAYANYDELYHHGIMGMKWGVRRYQNEDGSYTAAGRERYNVGTGVTNLKRNLRTSYETERNDPRTVHEREAWKKSQKVAQSNSAKSGEKAGLKQRRAQKTYERIHSIRNDETRMDRMSSRQLKSLKKAETYWKQRASGETPTEKRGFIKREADRYRSYNAAQRTGITAASQVLSSVGTATARQAALKDFSQAGNQYAQAGKEAVTNTAWIMAVNELLYSKLAGHF